MTVLSEAPSKVLPGAIETTAEIMQPEENTPDVPTDDPPGAASANVPTPPPLPPPLPPVSYATGGFERPFVSVRARARTIIGITWALFVVNALLAWPVSYRIVAWHGNLTGSDIVTVDDLIFENYTLSDLVELGLAVPLILLHVISMVLWMIWVYRTYSNLPALGAGGLTYSSGWAVGYYFIPILNLFRPFQVMSEAWRASDPRYSFGNAWQHIATPSLLVWWWALWLVSTIANWASIPFDHIASENAKVQLAAAVFDLVLVGVDAVLLMLMIRVTRGLTNLQEARADALGIP